MPEKKKRNVTGFVVPVGEGATGKTSLAHVLNNIADDQFNYENIIKNITKTKNLEFEFVPCLLDHYPKTNYQVMIQILVPPGQKNSKGKKNSRSYEDIIDIYRFHIKRVDVVLLTYKVINSDTFNQLEFWIKKILELSNKTTQYILLGTYLDQKKSIEVNDDQLNEGIVFLKDLIKRKFPKWSGNIHNIEISNLTGENMKKLKTMIAEAILKSREIIN